ncbi:MAG: DUF4982 domain-containing protein [Bacilli bacterium]|jgi:beta-galactosidase|nr:DUF4982 domain-containing protein [Bacilli bacterium]
MLFNDNWTFRKEGETTTKVVTLPHDAMLAEKRDITNPGGANISYFGGGKYYYEKDFTVSFEDGGKVYFEFEGVYHNAQIRINDKDVCFHPYGYGDFLVDATPYLNNNGTNHIQVIADNSDQPNSRWYSGSGIYRNVHLFVLPKTHILPRTLKVTTLDIVQGRIQVEVGFSYPTAATLEIRDRNKEVVFTKTFSQVTSVSEMITLNGFHLWNPETPYLYEVRILLPKDQASTAFGIRKIRLDPEKGFLINERRVILYGGCIHHDNGLLGAVADPYAEERRARLIKQAGYNAVRSAHNPISKAFLDVADRIGLLVMDEYVDCWYIHKTRFDYASYATSWYTVDLKDMVDKDYNHPSVILYSTGNEVAETSQKRGIAFTKLMTDYLHGLDSTRPITCGINIFFNALFSLGFGVYSDKKAEKDAEKKPTAKKKTVGSEFFNKLAGLLGAGFMKWGATLPISDHKTKGAFANLDVAGYNYGIRRYKHDLKKYPKRFILGSETFCADSGKFYQLSKDNPRIIGDFVWSAWDYLGEAGIGSWVAAESKEIYDDKAGWLLAGSGRIDILGNESAEARYTRTAFRKETISMAVISPKDYAIGHSPSSWKLSWAHYAYDFPGYEGKKTEVEVYSQAAKVELYQNGKLIGKAKKGHCLDGLYSFKITYQPGELKAVAFSKDHQELGSCLLMSAEKETYLRALPEEASVSLADGLCYIRLWFTDKNGVVKRLDNSEIEITSVTGGKLIGLGNACPYYKGSYADTKTKAYYGKALAIVRPTKEGTLLLTAHSLLGDASCHIQVVRTPVKEDPHP